jgi:hypothetical protein
MTIEEYENIAGEPMVLVIDEESDTAESMTKAVYEQRLAAKEAQSL